VNSTELIKTISDTIVLTRLIIVHLKTMSGLLSGPYCN